MKIRHIGIEWSLFAGFVFLALFSSVGSGQDSSPALLNNIRQLTYEGRRSGEGYFSPDGNALIFQSEREAGNPFYQIYILDLRTGDSHRVSPGIGKTTCSFFRNGTDEVLFASTHLDPDARAKQEAEIEFRASGKERRYSWDYDEHMDIFSAKRDGSEVRRLTDAPGYDAEGAFSPDGGKIVFCSLRNAYPLEKLSEEEQKRFEVDPAYFGEIYLMNADGSEQTRLTNSPGYDGGPFFSPDGTRILWRHFDESGVLADIYTMRLDGSDVKRLTDFGSMSWAPYFHPSGKYVIFASNKYGFGNFELFLVDAAGSREPIRVTASDGFDGLPVFSPDGTKLCWTSNRNSSHQSQLYLADWDHEAGLAMLEEAAPRDEVSSDHDHSVAQADETQSVASTLSPKITAEDLRAHVSYLASDALEGRRTGSPGSDLAADYINQQFEAMDLDGPGGTNNRFQEFEFTSSVETASEGNSLTVTIQGDDPREKGFQVEEDFRPLSFTSNDHFEGEVVFAGYGLRVPGESGEGYDSYAGLDVTNKVVLALRYVPEGVEPERRQLLNRYAGLRYKAMIAREHGAKALLVVSGPNSPNAGELIRHSFDTSHSNSEIIAVSITDEVANFILSPSGNDLQTLQTQLDDENPHVDGEFPIPNVKVNLAAAVHQIRDHDKNVLAWLPPNENSTHASEYVIVGAHYDHLGYGDANSLERKGEEGRIHHGADDNASGTAAVLELATSLSQLRQTAPEKFQRGVLFALWSGEEIGLIGSSHFTEDPPLSLTNAVAYVNFDMVGRSQDNKLILQGVGSSDQWRRMIEKRNVVAGFNLTLQDDPYLPTDVTPFYSQGVPVLNFFTGSHDDYHRPTDTADKINYQDLERIAGFAENIILDLAGEESRPEYAKVEQPSMGGGRDSLRAYLGTIPDYTTEVQGVKLSGVRGGGPADRGGIKGGDVIIEFGGQKITNIYDYTYALDAVKIGQPVQVVVQRDGETVTLTVVPEARN